MAPWSTEPLWVLYVLWLKKATYTVLIPGTWYHLSYKIHLCIQEVQSNNNNNKTLQAIKIQKISKMPTTTTIMYHTSCWSQSYIQNNNDHCFIAFQKQWVLIVTSQNPTKLKQTFHPKYSKYSHAQNVEQAKSMSTPHKSSHPSTAPPAS